MCVKYRIPFEHKELMWTPYSILFINELLRAKHCHDSASSEDNDRSILLRKSDEFPSDIYK